MEDGGCCLLLPREIKGIPAEKRGGKRGREKEDLEVASPKKKEERRADVPPPPSIHPRSYPPIPLNAIYIQNPLTWLRERRRRIFFLLVKGIEKKVRVGAKKVGETTWIEWDLLLSPGALPPPPPPPKEGRKKSLFLA